jgi:hypothetical protein
MPANRSLVARLAAAVTVAALVASCGSPLDAASTGAMAAPLAVCDVMILSLQPNADPPMEGAAAPIGAMIIAGPGDIDWAASAIGQDAMGSPTLELQLGPDAAARLADYTRDHIGAAMPLVLNGRVVAVPRINSQIPGGSLAIQGNGPTFEWLEEFETCVRG